MIAEASYGWKILQKALKNLENITFIIVDSRKTSAWMIATGIKNDKVDSEILAYLGTQNCIERLAVYQTSKKSEECFKLANHRNKLVQQRIRIKNQLKSFKNEYEENSYTGEKMEKTQLMRFMENQLLDSLNFLNNQIKEVEKMMDEISKDDPIIDIIQSIPGIGRITAFALRHKIDDISRFKSAANLSSYIGLGIKEKQSGENEKGGKISKKGNRMVRSYLIQGGQSIRTKKPDYVTLYYPKLGNDELMLNKIHANKVVIAIARKNLTFVYFCWKNGCFFDIEIHKQNRKKHALLNQKSC